VALEFEASGEFDHDLVAKSGVDAWIVIMERFEGEAQSFFGARKIEELVALQAGDPAEGLGACAVPFARELALEQLDELAPVAPSLVEVR
jgi:hypothetical protein